VSGDQLKQQVIRHIEQSMPWPKDMARIDVNTPPDISGLAKDDIVIRVETVGPEEYVGEMTFIVRISDGRQQRQATIHGRVEIMRDVVVSGRPLARDTVIIADDVRIKKKWVRHLDPDLLSSPENAIGKRVLIAVRGGAELKSQMLKEPVIVRKGKTVRINLERGSMILTTMGISEEDGSVGSTIRVRNMSSNRMVYAKVTGEDTVRIDY
jgi:flagella basal body P-ring formation protein FlgA